MKRYWTPFIAALAFLNFASAADLPARTLLIKHDSCTIKIARDAHNNVTKMSVICLEDSPLPIDRHLRTEHLRAIETEIELPPMGHALHPQRILTLPTLSADNAVENKDLDWQAMLPFSDEEDDVRRNEWLWPLKGGIPIFVEYENGDWGFMQIDPAATRNNLTSVTFYKLKTRSAPKSLEALLALVAKKNAWPALEHVRTDGLSLQQYKKIYLERVSIPEIADRMSKQLQNTPRLTHHFQHVLSIFAEDDSDEEQVEDTFANIVAISNDGVQKVAGIHLNFVASHWATIAILNAASQKNLHILMKRFEDVIVDTVRRAPEALSPKFYFNLFRYEDIARPKRAFVLNEFLTHHQSTNTDEVYRDFQKFTLYEIEHHSAIFFDELAKVKASDKTVEFILDLHLRESTSSKYGDAWVVAWLMKLVDQNHTGPTTLEKIKRYLNYIKTQKPRIWENALDNGEYKKFFQCEALLTKFPHE